MYKLPYIRETAVYHLWGTKCFIWQTLIPSIVLICCYGYIALIPD